MNKVYEIRILNLDIVSDFDIRISDLICMPTYFYTAIGKTGEKIKGSEAAQDERQLARLLRDKGLILTTVKNAQEKKRLISFVSFFEGFGGVSLTDKLLFTRNLQVMIEAGIPLPKSLDVLAAQTKNKRFKTTMLEVKKQVVQGKTLSEALGEYPKVFPELFFNMVKVGEESGTLGQVLGQLTLQLERQHELRSKVVGALLYPAVIVCAMIGIGILMLVVVVPQLAAVFKDLGVELPLTTRLVIGLGTLMAERWYLLFPGILLFLFILFQLLRTKPGKRVTDTISLKLPILSGVIQKANAALMTRTLSSLISSGVPIVRSLEITSRVVGNVYFRDSLAKAAVEVGKGAKLSDSLQAYSSVYPIIVIQMISVGEETGETGKILAKLADFFEEEVATVTKNLTSVIEPLLMLVIGAVVGFFAISMVQPMYSLLSGLQ